MVSTSLSVLRVGKPFLLADDEDHPINTMFCLAAKDSNAHIDLMQSLALLLTDSGKLAALNASSTSMNWPLRWPDRLHFHLIKQLIRKVLQ